MKVIILCGGRGTIDPETRQRIPKALMQVGDRPLIWHVMKIFATAGFEDFIVALGEGGEALRRYFLHQHIVGRDVEFHFGSGQIDYLTPGAESSWRVKCVDTGINAQTGSRVARCRRYVENETFITTYSDCLCDVDLHALMNFHRGESKVLTVTGVQPSSRFGTFILKNGSVSSYSPDTKLAGDGSYLNGGFMLMEPAIFDHLDVFNECNLERDVFSKLTAARQLGVFPHNGYWQAVDTERDLQLVTNLYLQNKRPWLTLAPPD